MKKQTCLQSKRESKIMKICYSGMVKVILTVLLVFLALPGIGKTEMVSGNEADSESGKMVSDISILSQPQILTVNAGQKATFSVIATGTAPLTYQWQKSSDGGSAWLNVDTGTGEKTTTYLTPPVKETLDGKKYRVKITNSGGSIISKPATLSVIGTAVAPSITEQPSDQTVIEGMPVTFGVLASGTEPITYKWTKNGLPITGATGSEYTTPANALSESGASYAVTVSNPFGKVTSDSAALEVKTGGPAILKGPESRTVAVGQTVTFKVKSAGTAPLSYQWQKNGVNLTGKTLSTYTTPVLTTAGSMIRYSVVVANSLGSVTSGEAVIKVVSALAPAILTQPLDSATILGQEVTLSVEASGSGTLGYQWRKNGTNIPGATTAQYNIANMSAAKEGHYDVIIKNTAGSITSRAALVAMKLGSKSIGSKGGTLDAGEVTLTIPPGALPAATVISLYDGGTIPALVSANAASRAYLLKGLPSDPRQPIQIRIPITQTLTARSMIRIDSGGHSQMVPATVDGDFLVANIGQGGSASSVIAAAVAEGILQDETDMAAVSLASGAAPPPLIGISIDTGERAYLSTGGHFRIWYNNSGLTLTCGSFHAYELLALALDHAYDEYTKTMGLSFSSLDFPGGVMDVYIYPFTGDDVDREGYTTVYYFHWPFGEPAMYIAINESLLKCGEPLRATAFHELMHVAATTATTLPRTTWKYIQTGQDSFKVLGALQDASCTAAESIGAGNLTYFPDTIKQQYTMTWDGLGVIGSGAKDGQNKGYALGGVFRYLSRQSEYGNTKVLGDIWRNLDKDSLINTLGLITELPPAWWHDFAYKYMTYGVYAKGGGFNPDEAVTVSDRQTKAVLPTNPFEYSHTINYAPFSAYFYDIDITKANYNSVLASELILSVEPGDPGTNDRDILQVSLIAFEKSAKALTPIVNGKPGEPINIPFSLLNDMKGRKSMLVVMVVTGAIGNPPWTNKRNIKFKAKLFSPDAWVSGELRAWGDYVHSNGTIEEQKAVSIDLGNRYCKVSSSSSTFSCNWDYTNDFDGCHHVGSILGAFNSGRDTLLYFQGDENILCPGYGFPFTRHNVFSAANLSRSPLYSIAYGEYGNCANITNVTQSTSQPSLPETGENWHLQSWYCPDPNQYFEEVIITFSPITP